MVPLTLKLLTVRIPADVEKEIREIVRQEESDKAKVVRNLLEVGIVEWRKQTALDFLRQEKATFAKAAEMAGLSLWEFADFVKQHNVEWVKYTPEEAEREADKAMTANGATR